LYFTKEVLYYECNTSQNIENPGYKVLGRLQFPLLLAASKNLSLSERMDRRQEYLAAWYQVVEKYLIRKLSHPGDKLQAIEGLAGTLRNVIDDVYLYGLWKSDLHRGLLWSSGYSSPKDRATGGNHTPSRNSSQRAELAP
jgi:hypothetical protein